MGGRIRLFVSGLLRRSYTDSSVPMGNLWLSVCLTGQSSLPSACLLWLVVFEAAGVARVAVVLLLLHLEAFHFQRCVCIYSPPACLRR